MQLFMQYISGTGRFFYISISVVTLVMTVMSLLFLQQQDCKSPIN